MYIFMANFKMRANTCTYFKNGDPLASSAQNIDILSGSNRSDYILWYLKRYILRQKAKQNAIPPSPPSITVLH